MEKALRHLNLDPKDSAPSVDDLGRKYLAMQQARERERRELEQRTANIRIAAEFHALLFQTNPALRLQNTPESEEPWELVESPQTPAPPPTPANGPSPVARHATPCCVFLLDEESVDSMGVD
tara:strand:- start:62 stop:427 length:366 start_codon:yes stop_codon:yes gene_type:complete